jgi:diacylglycerol kinase (ATP)
MEEVNPQKQRTGLSRLFHAFGYSMSGLRAAWFEKAFRQEAILALVLVPSAFWIGKTWLEIAMLVTLVFLVMVVELLNTGIESAIDRIGPEWHALAKRAKDIGSAAVLMSLVLCVGVWCAALWTNVIASS